LPYIKNVDIYFDDSIRYIDIEMISLCNDPSLLHTWVTYSSLGVCLFTKCVLRLK